MSTQSSIIEVDCEEVRTELVNYTEGDLAPELLSQIDEHLQHCRHCRAVFDGARNIVRLLGDEAAFELPEGFSKRLYQRLLETALA